MLRWAPILAALIATSSLALTLPPRSFDDVVHEADAVLVGLVRSAAVQRIDGRILTFYTVEITDTWKPSLNKSGFPCGTALRPAHCETVATLGGTIGRVSQHVAGSPTLSIGARYVLALTSSGPFGARGIFGFTQGVFALPDAATGDAMRSQFEAVR